LMEEFDRELEHLLADLQGLTMFELGPFAITPYTVWTIITLLVVFAVVWTLRSRISFIPKVGPVLALEAVVDYIKVEIGDSILGAHAREHMPFLLTIFFFILGGNLIGLIPGCKSATGTMSVTVVLALTSFCYFNFSGAKAMGAWQYFKSLAPAGLPPGVNVAVWAIEAFSMTLRIFSLAVRLFANMFAGHLTMGCFALLTSIYFMPMLEHFTAENISNGALSGMWMLILICVYAMELMVAFIQAYVFTLLSGVYIQLATSAH